MSDFKSLLKSISGNNPSTELTAAIDFLENHRDEEIRGYSKSIVSTITRSSAEIKNLRHDLLVYQTIVDMSANAIAQAASNTIMNDATALQALEIYTLDWFRRLPLSPIGKVMVAEALLAKYEKFRKEKPMLWSIIAAKDPEMLNKVKFELEFLSM